MSATYKQHQNAVAEALWAKLKADGVDKHQQQPRPWIPMVGPRHGTRQSYSTILAMQGESRYGHPEGQLDRYCSHANAPQTVGSVRVRIRTGGRHPTEGSKMLLPKLAA